MWSTRKFTVDINYSGIAAKLLEGDKMVHATFKLLLNLNDVETAVCNISNQRLKHHDTSSPILHAYCTGGVLVWFAGDFWQILPVILRGMQAEEVNASLKHSYLGPQIEKLFFSTNLWVHLKGDSEVGDLVDLLLKIGDGHLD